MQFWDHRFCEFADCQRAYVGIHHKIFLTLVVFLILSCHKMRHRRHRMGTRPLAVFAALILFFSAFTVIRDDLFLISKNLDIFSAVYRQVSLNYVSDTDPDALIKTALDAMLTELDPYTEYVPEAAVEDYRLKYVDTKYAGIGAAIFGRNEHIYIAEPYAGFPAHQAGLEAGDELVAINDVTLVGHSTEAVSHLLRGEERSELRLQIRKVGESHPRAITLTRMSIRQPNVSYSAVLEGAVGYIKLDKFLEHSAEELENALSELQYNQSLNGLIIDLRNNGGGILQEAVKVVNLFVPPGQVVVSQRGKNATKVKSYSTLSEPVAAEIPLAVLINGYSASAAEIVAGALQDLDRAVIVGERSFGKGLVQQTFSVPYNSLIKVTVAKYYTPSGRCIQAMEYLHDGNAGRYVRVADSLTRAFSTKNGRVVYDGSGIYPDIAVAVPPYQPITQTLLDRYLIFDYATLFKGRYPHIEDVGRFEITDRQYEEFMRFLSDKDYDYFSQTEEALQQLKTKADEEHMIGQIMPELESLERKILRSKQQELATHQTEIKQALESEIVSRYYYREGRLQFSLRHDEQLLRARSLLSSGRGQYHAILTGEGKYKMIGKPETLLAATETEN